MIVTITDGAGQIATARAEIPVAEKDLSNPGSWFERAQAVELTGDWREDIIAIAESQLGYRESEIDFIIDGSGKRQGYSIYGDLYGLDYVDWCAMFASACLRFAGVSKEDYPVSSSCNRWKNALIELEAYEPVENDGRSHEEYEGYMPQPGDLVYFLREGYPKDEPHHIGIVTGIEEGVLKTIEGNTSRSVARKEYSLTDPRIIGYANTETLMKQAGAYPDEALTVEIAVGSLAAQPLMLLSADEESGGLTFGLELAEGGLAFRCESVVSSVWDPETHTFAEGARKTTWSTADNGGDIMVVTNTSEVPVSVTVSPQMNESCPGLTATVNGEASATTTIPVNESVTLTIGLSGEFVGETSEAVTIGTIQIELAAAQ